MGGNGINYSIYGNVFEDENFELKHNQPGMLVMYNNGPNTNNAQFFITLDKLPNFDNKYVVFGIIVKGYDIVKKIENSKINKEFRPIRECRIIDCGIVKADEEIEIDDDCEETVKLSI